MKQAIFKKCDGKNAEAMRRIPYFDPILDYLRRHRPKTPVLKGNLFGCLLYLSLGQTFNS